jgi:hypothetical protein
MNIIVLGKGIMNNGRALTGIQSYIHNIPSKKLWKKSRRLLKDIYASGYRNCFAYPHESGVDSVKMLMSQETLN